MSTNETETQLKAQPAALLLLPSPSAHDQIAFLFGEARRHLDEADRDNNLAMGLCRTSLQKAKLAGDCLLEAKEAVAHGKWEARLAKELGAERIRSAQTYMQIAENWWEKIQPALEKDPDMSIKDALRLLSRGERSVPVDPDFQETLITARNLFSKAFPAIATWTDEDLFVLQEHFDRRAEFEVLRDEFYEGLEKVCARLQSRVRRFAAYRIGLDEEKRAKHLAWRAEQRRKEHAEDYNGPMVFDYTKPSSKSATVEPQLNNPAFALAMRQARF